MKKSWLLLLVLLACGIAFGSFAYAASSPPQKSAPASAKSTPGLEAAKALSTITGVAISPLLGVSAVGAWEYFHTPQERRNKLHWYAEPLFWVPALLLVAIVFLKDTAGTMLPTVLKKPLDVAEAVENKISGLVAAGAFVPLVVAIFPSRSNDLQAVLGAASSAIPFAMIDANGVLNMLLVPFAMIAFGIVWLVAHAIQVLIILSPFTTVDAALKAFRTSLLSVVTVTSFVNPYLGAFISLIILIVAYFLAGWSFRLMVFGQVYAWDLLTFRRHRFLPSEKANALFTSVEQEGIPIRTYGKLRRSDDGRLVFEYRPWLVSPKLTSALKDGSHAVGRGIFLSEIVRVESGETRSLFSLPPRYRGHEESLARIYELTGVRDVGLLKGLKVSWAWVKSLFGFRSIASGQAWQNG